MTKRILYLLGILFTIIIGTYFSWKLCCNNKKEPTKTTPIITKTPVQEPSISFAVKDADGNVTFSLDKDLKFKKSSIHFSSAVTDKLDSKIGEVKDFLIKENENSLSITGYYMSDEINNSAFPNIGFARAISIKNYIAKKGISTKIIDVNGELNDEMTVNSSNVMKNPLKFSVKKSKDQSAMINAIMKEIIANPLVLNFDKTQSDTGFTPKQRIKIVNISTYLDKVDDAFCSITGHTDNTGSNHTNIILGKKRADFIKQYLVKSGISDSRISVVSKGETEPIATNTTEKGRTKNRRVIVTVD